MRASAFPTQASARRKSFLLGMLAPMLAGAFSAFFLFAQNALEVSFSEVALPLFACAGLALACYCVLYFLSRRNAAFASIASVLLMLLFTNYNLFCALSLLLFNSERARYGFALVFAAAAILLAPLFLIRKKQWLPALMKGVLLAFSTLFLINGVTAIPGIVKRRSIRAITPVSPAVTEKVMPNFYYILSDEYAEFDTMREYYHYDLSPFRAFLEERRFSVSNRSYNATKLTTVNIANNLNFSDTCVNADTPEAIVLEKSANGRLYATLAALGYSTCSVSAAMNVYNADEMLVFDDMGVMSTTIAGKSPLKLLVDNSMLRPIAWRLPNFEWSDTTSSKVMRYLSDESTYSFESNVAMLIYILSPHTPYSHMADGTMRDRKDWYDVTNANSYLEQHMFVTSQLENILDTILAVDPNSVIVLQSDHNYRCSTESNDLPLNGKEIPYKEQCRILNAVYFCGEPLDIEGLSGPQTLRLVMEKLGAKIPE